jgi:hypothetical protein
MHRVSHSTKPNSGSDSSGESGNTEDNSEKFSLIKIANNRVKLLDILRHYGFKIEQNYQRPIWSNNIVCPLASHKGAKERTPSFGYHFARDYFSCFGCGKAGRAVEFIAEYEQIPRGVVAERILSQYGGNDITSDDFKDYQDDLTNILLDGSKYLQILIQKNKNNPKELQKIEKVIWWLDFYLMSKVQNKKIQPQDLEFIINKAKNLLNNQDIILF